MAEPKDTRSDPVKTLTLLWRAHLDPPTPPGRGPRPRFTIDDIIEAAIKVADTDGLEALSMRKVADTLGVGTMSIYTYVPGRAELLHLMHDTALAELPPLPADTDWRQTLEQYARQARDLATRHPWIPTLSAPGHLLMGPHYTARANALFTALTGIGLTAPEMVATANLLNGYIRGVTQSTADVEHDNRTSDIGYEQWWDQATPILERLLTPDRFPALTSVWEQGAFEDPPETGFEYGLQRLLDGIQQALNDS
jgi:AcrR family transcriptional regulator